MLYEKVYEILEPHTPKPELVIYLQASTEVLLRRIKIRRREVEADIAPEYVEQVNEAYRCFFHHYRASPLLVLKTSGIDFVKRPKDLDELVRQIERMEGRNAVRRPAFLRGGLSSIGTGPAPPWLDGTHTGRARREASLDLPRGGGETRREPLFDSADRLTIPSLARRKGSERIVMMTPTTRPPHGC